MRRKLLKISTELMEQLLREPKLDAISHSQDGFPADGKIVGVSYASTGDSFEPRALLILIVESETFERVGWGEPTPEMMVRFTKRQPA